jgi:DnaJ like chaperone protein
LCDICHLEDLPLFIFGSLFKGHCWWGKLLGAIFGYLMARSTGALIGILIGNFFDRALCEHFSRPIWQLDAERNPELHRIFLEATFCLLGYLAKADGRVSEDEIMQAQQFMTSLHLNKKQKELAEVHFNQGKQPNFNADNILMQFQSICINKPFLLHIFLDMQYTMAKVDGLNEKKIRALNLLLERLGLAPLNKQRQFHEEFDFSSASNGNRSHSGSNYRYASSDNLEQAHTLLGTNSNSSQQEVKTAYRRLISRNHPDKLIAKGATEAAIKAANIKTQTIRKAYEQICEFKHWS